MNPKTINMKHLRLIITLVNPIINLKIFIRGITNYYSFFRDYFLYKRMPGSEKISFYDISPRLHDKNSLAGPNDSSLYQNVWAFELINQTNVEKHYDIGSHTQFLGMLSTVIPLIYIDIRPYNIQLNNFTFQQGSILNLPFETNSIKSLSCLHTIEHIGLGRYGDDLDPEGSTKSINELQRVVEPSGSLYLSTPIGKSKVAFNAHRVFSPQYIIDQFCDMELVELSGIGKSKKYIKNIDIQELSDCNYGLGLFHFIKKSDD
jgi:hypothetical protein